MNDVPSSMGSSHRGSEASARGSHHISADMIHDLHQEAYADVRAEEQRKKKNGGVGGGGKKAKSKASDLNSCATGNTNTFSDTSGDEHEGFSAATASMGAGGKKK